MTRFPSIRFAARTSAAGVLLAAILACGACGKHPATQSESAAAGSDAQTAVLSPDLKRADLMKTVFPNWEDTKKGDKRVVDVEIPDRDEHGKITKTIVASELDVSPREVIRLDDTHAVMLTEGVEVTDTGERVDSYASGAWLGAYFFRRESSGWALERRIDGVDYGGVAGSYGQSSVARLSPSEFGVVLTSGGCWQGYCGSWASVYGVAPGQVRTLAATLRVAADNLGATEDCEAVLKSGAAPAASGSAQPMAAISGATADDENNTQRAESTDMPQCFNVVGHLEILQGKDAPGDLRIAFTGAETIAHGNAVRDVDETAIYRLKDGRYTLAEGRNPVPEF
ncbi:hypothetical protein C0Z18_01780 [Trinickia dabaoshanensis]|uniref:Lipoprotein n=2 Tax=Trinickia dabaoshanensis TaxID=564714 RepID=A0A2N7W3C5_9BURK|nr:hypothetical protein C0Z18_01780 [Trinickia dabaoshanensis]